MFCVVLMLFQQMCSYTERQMILKISMYTEFQNADINILLLCISVFILLLNRSCALGNEASKRKFYLVIKTPCFSCLIILVFLLFYHQINSMLMQCVLKGASPKTIYFRDRTGLVDCTSAKRSEKLGFSSVSSIVICTDHYK